jgi:hypothetical protein
LGALSDSQECCSDFRPLGGAESVPLRAHSVLRAQSDYTVTYWVVQELRRAGVGRSAGNKGADESGREAEGQEVRRGFSLCAAPS